MSEDAQCAGRPANALPVGWRWERLEAVCEYPTGTRNPQDTPQEEFRYVDISSVDATRKRIVEARPIAGPQAPSRARMVIRSGDVILSGTRPNLNAVALVPRDLDNAICSTGFCVLRAKPEIDPRYLFHYVQSPSFVGTLSQLVKGALYLSLIHI